MIEAIIVAQTFLIGLVVGLLLSRPARRGSVIDTSALLDGRFEALLEFGMVPKPIVIPSKVLEELDTFLNSNDRRYEKQAIGARRAYNFLETTQYKRSKKYRRNTDADQQVIRQSKKRRAIVVSLDKEVIDEARAAGLETLDFNAIYSLTRPVYRKGDVVSLKLLYRASKNRAAALSSHGEIIFVERAAAYIGQKHDVELTHIENKGNGRLLVGRLLL